MEEFIASLKEALQSEFAFIMGLGVSAEDESWERAARGVTEKMGVVEFKRDENPHIPCFWLKSPTN